MDHGRRITPPKLSPILQSDIECLGTNLLSQSQAMLAAHSASTSITSLNRFCSYDQILVGDPSPQSHKSTYSTPRRTLSPIFPRKNRNHSELIDVLDGYVFTAQFCANNMYSITRHSGYWGNVTQFGDSLKLSPANIWSLLSIFINVTWLDN